MSAMVVGLLLVAGVTALVVRDDSAASTDLAASQTKTGRAHADDTPSAGVANEATDTTTTAPVDAPPTAAPVVTTIPSPTGPRVTVHPPAGSSSPPTVVVPQTTTTVPVGQPITTRRGQDAHYTWIEGTGCSGPDARVLLELLDAAGQPMGDEAAIPRADGSWSVPVSPPTGDATIKGECVNFTTRDVLLRYPPTAVTFT